MADVEHYSIDSAAHLHAFAVVSDDEPNVTRPGLGWFPPTEGVLYIRDEEDAGWEEVYPNASTTRSGLVELATQSEADAGTDAVRAITPATLAGYAGTLGEPPEAGSWALIPFSYGGAIGPDAEGDTAGSTDIPLGVTGTLKKVFAHLEDAATGTDVIVQVRKNEVGQETLTFDSATADDAVSLTGLSVAYSETDRYDVYVEQGDTDEVAAGLGGVLVFQVAALESGATDLDDLADVNAPTPADGDALVWDDAAGEWVADAVSGGGGWTEADASETVKGIAEIATTSETNTGTDDARIVTPAKLAGRTATDTRAGVVELATDAETQTGTDTARAITPANLSARSATESRTGVAEIATQAETDTGTDDARIVTPLKLKTNLDLHVADSSAAHAASAISFSPTGTVAATDVQAAIAEVASEASGGSGYRTLVTLDTDRTNSTSSFADVTGLTFSVSSGVTYRFEAFLVFESQATTTGFRFAVNGPASPTILAYGVRATAGAASDVTRWNQAYDSGTATSGTGFTTNNFARIEGIVKPSASGTFAVRFASEAPGANDQITVKAGSTLEYW